MPNGGGRAEEPGMRHLVSKFFDWLRWGDPFRLQGDLSALLTVAAGVLARHRLIWWLEFGTLLGCVRHKSLIPWDFDLDIGLTADSLIALRGLMETTSLPPGVGWSWNEVEGYGRFTLGEIWVDLVGYAPDAAHGVWVPMLPEHYRSPASVDEYYPDHADEVLFPLGTGMIDGVDLPVPRDVDTVLRLWYGDWRRLDPIPLFFSALYHPVRTFRFVRGYGRGRIRS